MPFVFDCSVTMAWAFPDEATEAADQLRDSLIDDHAFIPSLWPVEAGCVLLDDPCAVRQGGGWR